MKSRTLSKKDFAKKGVKRRIFKEWLWKANKKATTENALPELGSHILSDTPEA